MNPGGWNELSLRGEEAQKILVADDDEATRILLRMALTQWGYNVIEAKDGEEAWAILQQPDPPKILTLDWLMPKLNGIELCTRIERELDFHPYIIFLTRMTGTENVIQGLESGADEFILKPFDLTELRIRIFAGERILKYREKIEELNKQLKEYSANIKSMAENYAKKNIPFKDLVTLLEDSNKILSQITADILQKNHHEDDVKKIKELQGRLSNIVDIIKQFTTNTAKTSLDELPSRYKIEMKMVPPEVITHNGESLINIERMQAFFGNDKTAIKDFITTFIALSNSQLNQIEEAIHNKDAKSAKYFFHLLGSASGNSGIFNIYELCGKAEAKVLLLDWEAIKEHHQLLKTMIEKLKCELNSI